MGRVRPSKHAGPPAFRPGAATRWIVAQNEAGARVDTWLARQREVGSRTRAREWIERGKVFLNSTEVTFDRAAERVRAGDEIAIWVDRPGSSRARSRDLVASRQSLRIVFEDDHLLVADKPPGLLVEPLPGGPVEVTLRGLVADHLEGSGALPGVRCRTPDSGHRTPGASRQAATEALVVHRIDRDTSGLVLFAKNERSQLSLKRQFERRTAERVYLAVLCGRLLQAEGAWKDRLVWDKARLVQRRARPDDQGGKEAVASYKVLEQFEDAALVEIRLVTGKRNQIRIQAALRHHPLVGERVYTSRTSSEVRRPKPEVRGSTSDVGFPRQALHAGRLAFRHPETGARVELHAPLPADLRELIEALRGRR